MIRTISTLSAALLALGGCSLMSIDAGPSTAAPASPPVATMPLEGGCEALRPFLPIRFHGGKEGAGGNAGEDTPDTIQRIRKANAAFRGACP